MHRAHTIAVLGILSCSTLFGCQDPTSPSPARHTLALSEAASEPAPNGVVSVSAEGVTRELWPFTGTSFDGTPQDPINLIFTGEADPRSIRAALLALSGDRTALGFPNAFPFNCTWSDAIGGVQTAYDAQVGWVGSAIQLQCGDFGPIRFHLRLFEAGDYTLAGVHFELLVPNTTEHAVLSWELAERLVVADLVRSGLLSAPPSATGGINPAPWKTILPPIYNGLPIALRMAIGGPIGNVTTPVPIGSDGRATILQLGRSVEGDATIDRQDFVVNFNQVIPKPFCAAGPLDYVLVQGPIDFRQQVVVTPSGSYVSQFHAGGRLVLTPINPLTGERGESYEAVVNERHHGMMTDNRTLAAQLQMQLLLPSSSPFGGRLKISLHVGTGGAYFYSADVDCGS
jgi:hypothetical protein